MVYMASPLSFEQTNAADLLKQFWASTQPRPLTAEVLVSGGQIYLQLVVGNRDDFRFKEARPKKKQ